jgi:hypothetical protein
VVTVLIVGFVLVLKNRDSKFKAPRVSASPVTFMVSKETTLTGLVNNLEYYGFIKDKSSFMYALEHTKDTTPGRDTSIKVEANTIDVQSDYRVSQTMTAWELADVLLNMGTPNDCSGGCPPGLFYPELLPGGDPAPSAKEIYEWVKTYENCVEAKGQLSSEQYAERTGIRKCVTPDGREFTKGKDGWVKAVGG